MRRRDFLKGLALAPIVFLGPKAWAGSYEERARETFGYYQGLGPTQSRDPRRTDGTYHNMPLIPYEDIQAGVEKTYPFWHGHGQQHVFTLTPDDFLALQAGETLEVYTNVVQGHRHAVRIDK